ncbi:DUF1870 family protein [Marinicellulosiphila megalodicopiae]|uniref:Aca2/YdiL-like domain-containing protein n=1 Tax=Marinicellulosiphila megalodicopiae TaxID=2724896 RepID=UPI003BB129ED
MSSGDFNNFELQAMRRLLMLDVSEAAELIGKVSTRSWQYWESGRSKIPDDIEMEMYGLAQMRNLLIDETLDDYPESDDTHLMRWYHTFDQFIVDYPDCNKVSWRLHQAVCAFMFAESGNISLTSDAPLLKNSYLYKWLNKQTDEQIEHARQEEIFNKRLAKKNK